LGLTAKAAAALVLTPFAKDLVLVGGGHSHVAVLRQFGMRPLPGVRITLISRTTRTPYSGMLPGLIAGYYTPEEAHIDLAPLTRFAGARFLRDEVVGIDLEARMVELAGRPPIPYDVLSINSGSTPALPADPAVDSVIPVKPIDRFLARWNALLDRLTERDTPARVGIVGGGAGGVELALAAEQRFRSERIAASLFLVTGERDILTTHNRRVSAFFRDLLDRRGVEVHVGRRVVAGAGGQL
jgi:selenide, water dikinase